MTSGGTIRDGWAGLSVAAVPTLVGVRLVGRSSQLAAVAALLAAARGGRGGLLVLTGRPGSGRTALLAAAAEAARANGQPVLAARAVRPQHPGLVWATLLRGAGAPDERIAPLLEEHPPTAEIAAACSTLATSFEGLVTIDDLDASGPFAVEVLAALAAQLPQDPLAVVVTSATVLGVGTELALTALGKADVGALCAEDRPEVLRALWTASRGLPGPALALAAELRSLPPDADPVVALALRAHGDVEFLDLDTSVIRLLEYALPRARGPAQRAALLAKLARELMGDTSTAERRRALLDEATDLAEKSGDPALRARVTEARLYALWAPDVAEARLSAAEQVVARARDCGDAELEVEGAFWRFVALVEAGRIGDAENALAAYERIAPPEPATRVLVLGRQAMLAILRGRFDDARALATQVAAVGERGGVPDTPRLVGTILGGVELERGFFDRLDGHIATFLAAARRFPGHFFEATAALLLLHAGRPGEASAELDRVLPRLLTGSGPRLLGSLAHAAEVAVAVGSQEVRHQVYAALAPYAGRFAVWGGANTCLGPVDRQLGRLATALGRPSDAVAFLERAAAREEHEGLLPGLARTLAALAEALEARGEPSDLARATVCRDRARSLATRLGMTGLLAQMDPPPDHWSLRRDADAWVLEAGTEKARLPHGRGVQYLATLLASPRVEIPATTLLAGEAVAPAAVETPMLDQQAVAAYRARLAALTDAADAADRAGNGDWAQAVAAERAAILTEVRAAVGLAGRRRSFPSEDERARVSVTKALRTTVERIEAVAPLCGAHLRASLRTGRFCRYDPAPGGPAGWRT